MKRRVYGMVVFLVLYQLCLCVSMRCEAQDKLLQPIKGSPDTCVSKIEYDHNQALYAAVCNILQYITTDGKITNRKALVEAIRHYLKFINPKSRSPTE